MSMKDELVVKGRLKVDRYSNGVLVEAGEWRDNVVTTAGKNALASLLKSANAGNTWVTQMAFGTGTTPAPNAADVNLITELSGNGYARQSTGTPTNPSANVIQYQATLSGITVATSVQEAGLMNASGTLIAHQLTGAQPLNTTSDSLQVTWQITLP